MKHFAVRFKMNNKEKYIKDFVKTLKMRYPDFEINHLDQNGSFWVYIKLNNKSFANVFIDNINGKNIISFNKFNTDEKFEIEFLKDNYQVLFDNLDRQIAAYGVYYKNIENDMDSVKNKISKIQKTIEFKLNLSNCQYKKDLNGICLFCQILDVKTQKLLSSHLMYRIMFAPQGYIVTLMFNDPFDEQIDFDADKEIDLFIKKFKDVYGGNKKIQLNKN